MDFFLFWKMHLIYLFSYFSLFFTSTSYTRPFFSLRKSFWLFFFIFNWLCFDSLSQVIQKLNNSSIHSLHTFTLIIITPFLFTYFSLFSLSHSPFYLSLTVFVCLHPPFKMRFQYKADTISSFHSIYISSSRYIYQYNAQYVRHRHCSLHLSFSIIDLMRLCFL